jgi:hypothetical protein
METNEMASSLFPDPLQMWRDALTKFENDANAMATGSMKSPELMRSLQQATAVSAGMQQAFEKVVEGYLRRANMPSRKEVSELAESLQRIEEKLDRLLPQEAMPRPARTRRPQAAAAPAAEAAAAPAKAAAAPAPAAAPATPRKRAAKAPAKAPARRRSSKG